MRILRICVDTLALMAAAQKPHQSGSNFNREMNRMKYSPEREITYQKQISRNATCKRFAQPNSVANIVPHLDKSQLGGTSPQARALESPIRMRNNAGRVPSSRIHASLETCWQLWQVSNPLQCGHKFNRDTNRITYSLLTSTGTHEHPDLKPLYSTCQRLAQPNVVAITQ